MVNPIQEVSDCTGDSTGTVQTRIRKPSPTEAEQNHQHQRDQKCGHGVDDDLNGGRQLIKGTSFPVAAMQPPQKPQKRAEENGRQRDLQGVTKPLPNQCGNGGFFLKRVPQCSVQQGAEIIPKLQGYRLVQMERLPVVSYLCRGHVLLGKAGQIGNGVSRQKPGKKEIQGNHNQEAHQCQYQVFSILFHRCASCVKRIISS